MNLITRGARRSARKVTNGQSTLAVLKTEAWRRARHASNQMTRQVLAGHVDAEEALFEPTFRIDSRDVS